MQRELLSHMGLGSYHRRWISLVKHRDSVPGWAHVIGSTQRRCMPLCVNEFLLLILAILDYHLAIVATLGALKLQTEGLLHALRVQVDDAVQLLPDFEDLALNVSHLLLHGPVDFLDIKPFLFCCVKGILIRESLGGRQIFVTSSIDHVADCKTLDRSLFLDQIFVDGLLDHSLCATLRSPGDEYAFDSPLFNKHMLLPPLASVARVLPTNVIWQF